MTCPEGCTYPESLLAAEPPTKSRYFTGISPAVIFVASLSLFAFLAVALGACIFAAIQFLFFFVLPLTAAAAGAFLVAAPETTPFGTDPTVRLLLRVAGAIALAYAGTAMLVSRSSCSRVRSAHLLLVAASLGIITVALAADETSAIAGEVGDKAAVVLRQLTVAATAGAFMVAASPLVTEKIQSGKPAEPSLVCFG